MGQEAICVLLAGGKGGGERGKGGGEERRGGENSAFLPWRILTEYYVERGIRDKIDGVCFQTVGPIGMERWTVLGTMGEAAFERKVF